MCKGDIISALCHISTAVQTEVRTSGHKTKWEEEADIIIVYKPTKKNYLFNVLTSCSRLLYSPSVFSLMMMMSIFLWRVCTPGRDWQCITLAYKSRLVLLEHDGDTEGGKKKKVGEHERESEQAHSFNSTWRGKIIFRTQIHYTACDTFSESVLVLT